MQRCITFASAKEGRSPGRRHVRSASPNPMLSRRLQRRRPRRCLTPACTCSVAQLRGRGRSTGRRDLAVGRDAVLSHRVRGRAPWHARLPARVSWCSPTTTVKQAIAWTTSASTSCPTSCRRIGRSTNRRRCRSRRPPGRSSTLPQSSIRPGCGSSSTSSIAARLVDDVASAAASPRWPSAASRAFGRCARSSTRAQGSLGVRRRADSSGRRFECRSSRRTADAPRASCGFLASRDIDGCVDFGWPEARLIVEADGRRWHTRIADLRRDRERDNQAARAGWQTLRFLHESIDGRPRRRRSHHAGGL